jgi:hypothetical protein
MSPDSPDASTIAHVSYSTLGNSFGIHGAA